MLDEEYQPLITRSADSDAKSPVLAQESTKVQQGSNLWLLASLCASLFFTVSVVIRGVMSGNILVTKGLLCVASFGHGVFYIVFTKCSKRYKGESTDLCWN